MAFPVLGIPRPQFTDENGDPYNGGTLEIRNPADDANKSTYPTASDADAATNANSADLTLNQRGEPSVDIWGVDGQEYKVTLKDASGAALWSSTDIGWDPGSVQSTNVRIAQTTAETNAGVTPTSYHYLPGDVRRYGAAIDGTTADQAAFQAAFDQNVQTSSDAAGVRSPQGDCYFSAGATWCNSDIDDRSWFCEMTRIITDQDITPITIGPTGSSAEVFNVQIHGGLEIEYTGATAAASLTNTGLLIRQCYEAKINVGVKGFRYGLQLTATDSGCNYNQFWLSDMRQNWRHVWLNPDSPSGNVNENRFVGGRFSIGTSGSYDWYVYLQGTGGSNTRPNNNRFVHPSFEGPNASTATINGCYFDGGAYNLLEWPRLELGGSITVSVKEIYLAPTSLQCGIFGGRTIRVGDGSDNSTVLDVGRQNSVWGVDGWHMNPARSGAASQVINIRRDRPNSDDVPIIEVHDLYDNGNSPMGYSSNMAVSRYDAASAFHYRGQSSGSLVSTGLDTNSPEDLIFYECIQDHDSGVVTTAEPPSASNLTGGADWRDYWVCINGNNVKGGSTQAWATSTAYTGRTTRFLVDGEGFLHFPDASGDATAGPTITSGSGVPAAAEPNGSLYLRTDGTGPNLYVRQNATWQSK